MSSFESLIIGRLPSWKGVNRTLELCGLEGPYDLLSFPSAFQLDDVRDSYVASVMVEKALLHLNGASNTGVSGNSTAAVLSRRRAPDLGSANGLRSVRVGVFGIHRPPILIS